MSKEKIAIVTDSAASLPDELRRQSYTGTDILEVPFTIVVKREGQPEKSWIDHPLSASDRAEFVDDLNDESAIVSTSQPNPEDYTKALIEVIDTGVKEIVIAPISGKLSGSIQSAYVAADNLSDRANIVVADCKAASVAQGLLVTQAASENKDGRFGNANELANRLDKLSDRFYVAQAFSSLEHLRRGGRIGRAACFLGGILNIIPIIGLDEEGALEPIDKGRGWRRSRELIIDHVSRTVGQSAVRLAIVHFVTDQMDNLKSDMSGRFNIALDSDGKPYELMVGEQSAVLSSHTGPGVIGLCALDVSET